jgi:hypothetical protein
MLKDKRTLWQYGNPPLTAQFLSPLGRGEPQSNLISIFLTANQSTARK